MMSLMNYMTKKKVQSLLNNINQLADRDNKPSKCLLIMKLSDFLTPITLSKNCVREKCKT